MSDSLIAWNPRIDEPSKPTPSLKVPSSTSLMLLELCCQVPKRSINRKSTIFTPASLAIFKTSDGDFAIGHPFFTTHDRPIISILTRLRGGCTQHEAQAPRAASPGPNCRIGFPGGATRPVCPRSESRQGTLRRESGLVIVQRERDFQHMMCIL